MKGTKVVYWASTIFIFLFEGVMTALTSQTEMAKEGIRHLGYPEYFGTLLAMFAVAGSLALIIPQVPRRVKEWAYAGFGLLMISALVSHAVVDGLQGVTFAPVIGFAIVAASYVSYHAMMGGKKKK